MWVNSGEESSIMRKGIVSAKMQSSAQVQGKPKDAFISRASSWSDVLAT